MTDEKYFSLNPDNFHEVSDSGKGFFNALKDANRQVEYEKSNFYREIPKKLYEDGQMQIEYLKDLIEEKTPELTISKDEIRESKLRTINLLYENKHDTIDKYYKQRELNDLEHYVEFEFNNNAKKLNKLKSRLEITEYVFSNGFEHFMAVTKKYGNTINGINYIIPHCFTDNVISSGMYVYDSFFKVEV